MLGLLLAGLALVILGVLKTAKPYTTGGIWLAGPGTILVGLTILLLPAYNHTSFYPSTIDPQSSLTINNASSSAYTLGVMTYVAISIPFVLAYVAYVWRAMDKRKLNVDDVSNGEAY